jgi:hypothetical protein
LNQIESLVEVYVAKGETEAHIVKGLLESFGITCVLNTNRALIAYPYEINPVGQVSILVQAKNAESAKELVKGENNA